MMNKELRSNARKPLVDIAAIVDAESGLPRPGRRLVGGVWIDDYEHPTLRVADIEEDPETGDYVYPITDELADRIAAAKAHAPQDRTPEQQRLAAGPPPQARGRKSDA